MKQINGITDTDVGYMTTKKKEKQKPTYKKVSKGNTLFAETVKVVYDPNIISYETLVETFFRIVWKVDENVFSLLKMFF